MEIQITVNGREIKVAHKDLSPDQVLMCLNAALELMRRKMVAAEVMELMQMAQLARQANKGGLIIP